MSNKKRRLPSDRNPPDAMILRMVSVRSDTASDDAATVAVVIASENPVSRYDEQRGTVVSEVLKMDGVQFRTERKQLPIVDSHDRSTVRNILGSVRNLRIEGDELVGDASFARDEESQIAYQKLRDGHITDFSITATPTARVFIPRGEVYRTSTNEVPGPAEIITSWIPTDASLVATGADERSTVRNSLWRSYHEIERNEEMNAETRQALVDRGMPEEMESTEEILNWLIGRMDEKPEEEVAKADEPGETGEEEASDDGDEMAERQVDVSEAVQRAIAEDRKRQKEIRAICTSVGLERAYADQLCESGCSLDDARGKVIERMAKQPIGQQPSGDAPTAKVTESSDDKFYSAARDGLLQRAFTSAGIRRSAFGDNGPAVGAEDFRHVGLNRMAERFVQRMGVNTNRMSARDIAMVAMGHPSTLNRFNIQREAYHSTGSFANLMLDASNKSLLAAYEEAPHTWSLWARQAASVSDFKNINRIRFSEMASPEMVPENQDYPEAAMSDSKESYKVEKYGSVFSVTWETVVNDDLDAISRIPAMQGAACRRKQNAAVYGVLTANANLADGGALFNATAQTTTGGHANLAGSGAVISTTTLNTGFTSMMTKTGLNSAAILNIQPSFLIVPAAISATALQVVGSIADPSVGGSAAGNSNVLNIYGPNGSRPLRVVVDPQLDGNSATAWYLAASSSQVDTVELSFLSGEESPVLENEWDFDKDVYKYKVRQTFGVAAIDFRGLYKNPGA